MWGDSALVNRIFVCFTCALAQCIYQRVRKVYNCVVATKQPIYPCSLQFLHSVAHSSLLIAVPSFRGSFILVHCSSFIPWLSEKTSELLQSKDMGSSLVCNMTVPLYFLLNRYYSHIIFTLNTYLPRFFRRIYLCKIWRKAIAMVTYI